MEILEKDERKKVVLKIIKKSWEYVGEMDKVIERMKEMRSNVMEILIGILKVEERRGEIEREWREEKEEKIMIEMVGGFINEWLKGEKGLDIIINGRSVI